MKIFEKTFSNCRYNLRSSAFWSHLVILFTGHTHLSPFSTPSAGALPRGLPSPPPARREKMVLARGYSENRGEGAGRGAARVNSSTLSLLQVPTWDMEIWTVCLLPGVILKALYTCQVIGLHPGGTVKFLVKFFHYYTVKERGLASLRDLTQPFN